MKYVSPSEARALLAAGDVDLVDVREAHEWATGHLPGARLVPLGVLKADPRKAIPRDRVLFVCAKGGRSQTAGQVAEMLGFVEVYSLDGGTEAWAREGLPLERPEGVAPVQETAAPEAPPSDLDVRLPELDVVISANLKELRTARGLSLDATAQLTGLSRTLLGQIELGTTTPSLGVLWKIARAFDVPFATLLAAPRSTTTAILRKANARRLVSADGRFSSRALFPFGENQKVEFYELWLAPHAREEAEAHRPGTRENLVVYAGRLALEVDGARHELDTGDAVVFSADVPHVYINPGNEECRMHLVMTYA